MSAGMRINGTDYTLDDLQNVPMGDLFVLKSNTAAKGSGVSLKTINAMFDDLSQKAQDPDFNALDLLDDNAFIANMVGLVYLVRRSSGETFTVDEAWATPFNAVEFISDEDEVEAPKGETLEPELIVS